MNSVKQQAVCDSAVKSERERCRQLEELIGVYDPETIKEAMYGPNICTAAELLKKKEPDGGSYTAQKRMQAARVAVRTLFGRKDA